MSGHNAVVEWALRSGDDFLAGRYSRAHTIGFDGGVTVPGSASPSVVRAPWSVEAAADPEELLVAAISACHMLWFLDFAKHDGILVHRYRDAAEGRMGKNAQGKPALTECVLRPHIEADASPERIAALHHKAHEACFIANSVTADIRIEPVDALPEEISHG